MQFDMGFMGGQQNEVRKKLWPAMGIGDSPQAVSNL